MFTDKKKTLNILVLGIILAFVVYAAIAQSTGEGGGGSTTPFSTGSGGGGGGTATTNGDNVFSGNNTFTGNNSFSGNNTHTGNETFANINFATNNGTLSIYNNTNIFRIPVYIGINQLNSDITGLGGQLYIDNTNIVNATSVQVNSSNSDAIVSLGSFFNTHTLQLRRNNTADEIKFAAMNTASPTRFTHNAGVGFLFQPTDGTTVFSINGSATTNVTAFVGMDGMTASNFVQRTGSAGGFVGNASGLTNFPANVVVTNGTQIISGSKTFTSPLIVSGGPTSSLDSGTNTTFNIILNGTTGGIPGVYVTNVVADFPSIVGTNFNDITFPVPSTMLTNSIVEIGRPVAQLGSLVTEAFMTNNGLVLIRAHNASLAAADQPALPYRIQITILPSANSQ